MYIYIYINTYAHTYVQVHVHKALRQGLIHALARGWRPVPLNSIALVQDRLNVILIRSLPRLKTWAPSMGPLIWDPYGPTVYPTIIYP